MTMRTRSAERRPERSAETVRGPRRLRGSGGRLLRAAALAGALALPLAGAAQADSYEPERAGHPLRIVAYALHPVGVTLDYLVMRPAHWLVSHEPLRTFFGHTGD